MAGIQFQHHVEGVDELMQRLHRATSTEVRATAMERLKQRLLERLTKYPPTRPGSTYQRTGNLGRAWRARVTASGTNQYASQVGVELTNNVRGPDGRAYGPFVQGDKTQAHMHRGRWTTDQQALDDETPSF